MKATALDNSTSMQLDTSQNVVRTILYAAYIDL